MRTWNFINGCWRRSLLAEFLLLLLIVVTDGFAQEDDELQPDAEILEMLGEWEGDDESLFDAMWFADPYEEQIEQREEIEHED